MPTPTLHTLAQNATHRITPPLFYPFIRPPPLPFFYPPINTCHSILPYKNHPYFLFPYFTPKTHHLLNYIPTP
ncbi:cobalamin biosynthesis protein, partial [Priestia megaterium]|uniref:cobalamin biosynthesis protein n=1 Tax=Priestia megaterium TaxID=1404 RepID=UPI0037097975